MILKLPLVVAQHIFSWDAWSLLLCKECLTEKRVFGRLSGEFEERNIRVLARESGLPSDVRGFAHILRVWAKSIVESPYEQMRLGIFDGNYVTLVLLGLGIQVYNRNHTSSPLDSSLQ